LVRSARSGKREVKKVQLKVPCLFIGSPRAVGRSYCRWQRDRGGFPLPGSAFPTRAASNAPAQQQSTLLAPPTTAASTRMFVAPPFLPLPLPQPQLNRGLAVASVDTQGTLALETGASCRSRTVALGQVLGSGKEDTATARCAGEQ
jgi:hypothetical protein